MSVKGIGNYRQPPAVTTDRRLAQVAMFHGPRASVRLVDGSTHTMNAEPLRKLGLAEGDTFLIVTEFRGKEVLSVRVEKHADARGQAQERARPKIMVRDGLKLTTRR